MGLDDMTVEDLRILLECEYLHEHEKAEVINELVERGYVEFVGVEYYH